MWQFENNKLKLILHEDLPVELSPPVDAGRGCSRAMSSANAGSPPPFLTATHTLLQHGGP